MLYQPGDMVNVRELVNGAYIGFGLVIGWTPPDELAGSVRRGLGYRLEKTLYHICSFRHAKVIYAWECDVKPYIPQTLSQKAHGKQSYHKAS